MSDTLTLPSAFQEGVEAAEWLLDTLQQLAGPPAGPSAESLEPVYYAGYNALAAGQYEDAQATFLVLVSHAPRDPRFFAGLGKAQQALGRLDEASLSLALANHLDPQNMGLRIALAEVALALNHQDHARMLLMQVKALTEHAPQQAAIHQRASAMLTLMSHGA